MITFMADKDRLFTLVNSLPDEEFVPETATHFISTERDAHLTFSPDAAGKVSNVVWLLGKYKLTTSKAQQYVPVYVTSDGLVTDYDVVSK